MKKINNMDRKILETLKANGRSSYRAMGKDMDVPHTTVFTRVQRLVEIGVIKRFTIEIDERKLKEAGLVGKSAKELIDIVMGDEK